VNDPGFEEYMAVRKEISITRPAQDDDPVDEHGSSIVWNELFDAQEALAAEIMQNPILTAGDIVLQARVAAMLNNESWDDEPQYSDERAYRQLVENICRHFGTVPFPRAVQQ
jgi:hypothetical protein